MGLVMAMVEGSRPASGGVIKLNRPERRNAASRALMAELATAFESLEAANDAGATLLTLLVEAVLGYIASLGDRDQGWLRGLSDPNIGRALALIHGDIAASWSVDALAREVGLSRSTFTDRFVQLIGMPPIRYLTVWRLESGKRRLRESRKSIPQIAKEVGYESEEGFRRAFKREFEVWPAEWRDQQRVRPTAVVA
jgi:AraC-like DNA-binding protein